MTLPVRHLLTSLPLLCFHLASGQTPDWLQMATCDGWTTTYAIAHDATGNLYICGEYESGPMVLGGSSLPYTANQDAFVAKVSPDGTVLWLKRMGGSNDYDGARDVAVDAAGNVYVTGYCGNDGPVQFGSFSFTPVGDEMFLVKINPSGTFLWLRHTDGPFYGHAKGVGLDVNHAGDIVLCGNTTDYFSLDGTLYADGYQDDMFLASYNTAGALQWCDMIEDDDGNEQATDVAFDDAGDFYFAGRNSQEIDLGGGILLPPVGTYSPFVAKYQADGTPLWATSFGSDVTNGEVLYDLEVDAANNAVICGYMNDGGAIGEDTLHTAVEEEAFLACVTPAGSFAWSRYLASGSGYLGSQALGLHIAPDNSIYVCGGFAGDSTEIEGTTYDNEGNYDMVVWRYTASGDPIAHLVAGGNQVDRGADIDVDADGSVFLTGHTYSMDCDVGSTVMPNPNGTRNAFLLKWEPGIISVPEVSALAQLLAWPNPAQDRITVRLDPDDRIIVRDLHGRVLCGSNNATVHIEHLAPGLYLLEKRDRSSVQVARFEKQ